MIASGRLTHLRREGGFFQIRDVVSFLFTGGDAARYLNGQLSIDVKRLTQTESRPACLLTAKGKLVAPVRVRCTEQGFVLEVPAALEEAASARLERYIIADDVAFSRLPDTPFWHVFGHTAEREGISCRRIGLRGWDVRDRPESVMEASSEEVETLRISLGVPRWGSELTPETLPQEARLEDEGVDFDKGCYVGQEVVSRLRSVGRVNRRLHLFRGKGEFTPGAALVTPAGDTVGDLTSVAQDFELAQTVALGYLRRTFEDLTDFQVRDSSGAVLGEVERCEFPSI